MTEPTDRTEHVPGQLELTGKLDPHRAVLLGGAQGIAVPSWVADHLDMESERQELREQSERLDMALLEHRADAIDRVRKKATSAVDAGTALDAAVSVARSLGATWEQIGTAAGMTRQSAWRRWSTGAYPGGPDEVEP